MTSLEGRQIKHVIAGALLLAALSGARAQEPQILRELDQGWAQPDREWWWSETQGSRLIPLDWFKALEVADGQELFASTQNLARFGYLKRTGSPDALPVGFAIDRQVDERFIRTGLRWKSGQRSREPWVGLTCAACHTGTFKVKGQVYFVDGAGAPSDFQAFMTALNDALAATQEDPAKWGRFADRVLGKARTRENTDPLADSFDRLLRWQQSEANVNATDLVYGPGRIDAFGHIYNKVALLLNPPGAKLSPSDAPVSTPYIWRATQLDRLQYNGIVEKSMLLGVDVGGIGRNAGEVIGVFGDVVVHSNPNILNGFKSSVNIDNLIKLEQFVRELRPPKWPESVLGRIDQTRAVRGKDLYNQYCASCHVKIDRRDLFTPVKTYTFLLDGSGPKEIPENTAPGTDPWAACNGVVKKASPGILGGFSGNLLTDGKTLPKYGEVPLSVLLRTTVTGVMLNKKGDLAAEIVREAFRPKDRPGREALSNPALGVDPRTPDRTGEKLGRYQECMVAQSPILGYSSRPLNGIWATAPYLHNGSVPNMEQLLLPPGQRVTAFRTGSFEYDSEAMGIPVEQSLPDDRKTFQVLDKNGKYIDGNANTGHDYGTSLKPEERRDLIEFLKML